MDVRIASEAARFGFVFTRRDIVPESCPSWFLPRIVGIAPALDWFEGGRVFPAAEALADGLVTEVLAPDRLLARARDIGSTFVEHTAPVSVSVSVSVSRRTAWNMLAAPHPMHAHVLEPRIFSARRGCPDTVGGIQCFLEMRPAAFPMSASRDVPALFLWSETPPFAW